MRNVIFPSPLDVCFQETTRKPPHASLTCRADLRSVFRPRGYPSPWCRGITARTQNKAFQLSLPDLIRQSMQRTRSLSLSVASHTPAVTMDHRVKPGGDAVGSLWSILCVEGRVAGRFGTSHKMG